MIPQRLHKLYADILGYFWIACPVCGRMFGGHQTGAIRYDTPYTGTGRCICNRHGDCCKVIPT